MQSSNYQTWVQQLKLISPKITIFVILIQLDFAAPKLKLFSLNSIHTPTELIFGEALEDKIV